MNVALLRDVKVLDTVKNERTNNCDRCDDEYRHISKAFRRCLGGLEFDMLGNGLEIDVVEIGRRAPRRNCEVT